MIKTNTKKARENVRAYIIETTKDWLEIDCKLPDSERDTFEKVARYILDYFEETYARRDYRRRRGAISNQDLFEEWSRGLPAGALFDYYLATAVDDLGEILEETEEEKARFSQDMAEKRLTCLIYSELTRVCRG